MSERKIRLLVLRERLLKFAVWPSKNPENKFCLQSWEKFMTFNLRHLSGYDDGTGTFRCPWPVICDIHTLLFCTFYPGRRSSLCLSAHVFVCEWIFNPLLKLSRRPSRLCYRLNFCFRRKAWPQSFESVSKTKPIHPKFFDSPSSAVWHDRHRVYKEKPSNRRRRGKFTRRSRLAGWSTSFCYRLKMKVKANSLL